MDIAINTAQNVNIACKPAGLLNRIGATLIDLAILGGILLISSIGISAAFPASTERNIALLIVLIILTLYHLLSEFFFNGRSLGKSVLHLRVIRLDGKKLSFWDCMLRWVLRLIDISASMGILAILSIVISSKMQRLGDLAASTTVINETPGASLQQISLYDTPEDYEVSFPQVSVLSDKDVNIMKEVLLEVEKNHEYSLLEPLSLKIKELTGIQSNLNNLLFVRTVIRDYLHLTKQ